MWQATAVRMTGRAGVVVAVLALAGCGGSDTKALPGGIASGPGFTVKLPRGWRAFNMVTETKIDRQSRRYALGKGISGYGVLDGGHWVKLSGGAQEAFDVEVEPITADEADATITQEQTAALRRVGATRVRQLGSTIVDGVPATITAYRLQGLDLRVVYTRRGNYLYSITVTAKHEQGTSPDSLLKTVVGGWRWTSTAVPALAQLSRVSGTGYKLTLPPGWKPESGADAARAGVTGADSAWIGYTDSSGQTFAAVFVEPARSATLAQLVARELKDGGKRLADEQLGGATAAVLDISSKRFHIHEWVVLHGGRDYVIAVRTSNARAGVDDAAVRKALDSWQFTS